jgi:hypothetical protein
LENLTGRTPSELRETTAVADLRAMIAIAEVSDVDSIAHLSDLDRVACSAEEDPGTRALAAQAAVFVRRPQNWLALISALSKARKALKDPETNIDEKSDDCIRSSVDVRVDMAFGMGYVESLWRGIEHLLPEGVSESRGKMPEVLAKVARTH